MRVAVVGSGISGLAAAWLLARRHEVVLFEQDDRLGGHSNTVQVPGGPPVDTGFIVYNEGNYPNLTALFRQLDLPTGFAPMSFGVSIGEGAFEYAGDGNLLRMFAQRRNWLSPRHHRMWIEILRFNRAAERGLRAGDLPEVALGEWLDRNGYGREFQERYLLPMAGAIWSCSTRAAREFPYPSLARFFDAHGLLNVITGPKWRFVRGGSRSYVQRLRAQFRGEVRTATPVTRIRRTEAAAWLTTRAGEERFGAVVCAAHADQALALLADADASEQAILGAVPYADNEAVLHTDESLMPKRRAAWASWNYLAPAAGVSDRRVTVTYWMNRLQDLPGPVNYLVTLNPGRQPDAARVLYRTRYAHPVFSGPAVAAQRRLGEIQGRRHTWFCGAWTGYGFHEDGLRSGLQAAAALGCPADWARQPPAAAPVPGANVETGVEAGIEPA